MQHKSEPIEGQKSLKRKRKYDDRPYSSKRARTSAYDPKSRDNLLAIRTETSVKVMDDKGEETDFKIAVLIDKDKLSTPLKSLEQNILLQQALDERFEKVGLLRPVAEIVETSSIGSPLLVTSPQFKSRLYRVANLGVMSIFSNQKKLPAQTKMVLDNPQITEEFFASEPYKSVKKITILTKSKELKITPEVLAQTKKDKSATSSRRSKSQSKVMAEEGKSEKKARATDYASQVLGVIPNFRWEWLHLIAHMIQGETSQSDDNLVAGPADTNTWMMLIERAIPDLTEKFPEGFSLKITADLIPSTHIVKKIHYALVMENGFHLPFEFDAQNPHKPHIMMANIISILIDELTSVKPKVTEEKGLPLPSSVLFYSKSKHQAERSDTVEPKPSLGPKK